MQVRVKEGMCGFIYNKLYKEGEKITLEPVETTKDGKPFIYSAEDQFSNVWMEKAKGRPKKAESE